jgi:DNA polymerase V
MDCNNFFVSCERLFRPDLRGKPVAVLSSNDGCVVARSQEVKDIGIPMGAPLFQIKDMCKKQDITLFSSNFALYRDVSSRVMSALKDEFSRCEIYSVDEAFFSCNVDLDIKILGEIRARIIQKTGIPVSIGVAPTKTLAKIANGIAKKSNAQCQTSYSIEGVCVMGMDEWKEIRKTVSCGSVWGIGRQTSAFLTKNNIYTVSDFLSLDASFVKQSLGVVGERLRLELTGVEVYSSNEKLNFEQESYTSTRSFRVPIHDKITLMSALGHHTAVIAEKLRKNDCLCSRVTIVARGSRFGDFAGRNGTLSTVLVTPTNDTFVLTREVSALLDILFDGEIPYKKAGVVVSGIEPFGFSQASLFKEAQKTDSLSELEDSLNKRFGNNTIRHGVTLNMEKWQERKEKKSPNYTTEWNELATVKAI